MDRPPKDHALAPSRDAARTMTALAVPVLAAAWWIAPADHGAALALGAAGWGALSIGVVAGVAQGHPHPRFGAANIVTSVRAAGALLVVVLGLSGGLVPGWPLFLCVTGVLALDGVDGALARMRRQSSAFGAAYDMETDSAFALILALLVWQIQPFGPWVLALGLPRYVFWAASRVDATLCRPLVPSKARKAVCALQIGTLCLLTLPALPVPLAHAMVGTASLALVWSFGRDIVTLKSA